MYVACLTSNADGHLIRRSMRGVPRIDSLILNAADGTQESDWVANTLRELRCELFLDPELSVLIGATHQQAEQLAVSVSSLLCESRCYLVSVGVALAKDPVGQLRNCQENGEPLRHVSTGEVLPQNAQIEAAQITVGAAPIVDALEAEAKIVIAATVSPGALGGAAVYESLRLDRQDWDRLATLTAIAQIIEVPGNNAPLWLEVDAAGSLHCIGSDTFTVEAFERCLTSIADLPPSTDVAIDLTNARVLATSEGRYKLTGVVGRPPEANYPVELTVRLPNSARCVVWPTKVRRAAIDWEVIVASASDWAKRNRI